MNKAVFERPHPLGGVQKIYRFNNGIGLSVSKLRNPVFVNLHDSWCVALIHFSGKDPLRFEVLNKEWLDVSEDKLADVLIEAQKYERETQ